ncbi:energy-coupling factor ABC transporter permease [Oceanimonas sp. CHS3-5]|uniref:energy-coupling factor ABC transporter permease n=1 Tax=Oceanimonas sp. CHS3-5 TaxID=3068186 RepID=UPI00273F6BEF|nr:energy-coupling factor ABC transporter permease [Oceanimonas sp. CHS3-5]MDP5292325.1 energy-coupling factor ABC transporter permease [Oceanimonas sp. CHS3-5]
MMLVLGAAVMLLAAWRVNWHALIADKSRQHLCFGAGMALVPLWMLQAGIREGLEVHFLGLTTLALMLGWRLSQLMALLALLLVTAFGFETWPEFGANLVLGVILPIAVSYFVFLLTYSYLYRHLFVYIFVAGFFNAALTMAVKSLAMAGYMVWSGQYGWQMVQNDYLSILPLLLFPEALLNGMAITLLVVFRPQWVCTFYDRDYLINK